MKFRDERLGLADVEAIADDAVEGELLQFFSGEAEDDLGVADGKLVVADGVLDGRRVLAWLGG